MAADTEHLATFHDRRIAGNDVQERRLNVDGKASFVTGQTRRAGIESASGQSPNNADIALDTKVIAKHGPDTSGVTTTGHEMYHAMGIFGGFSDAVVHRGDEPTNATGPAEAFGKLIMQETPDITKEEAAELVKKWLSGGSTSSQTPPLLPPY